MNPEKREKLSKQGWTVGTVAELLQLTPAETIYLELKLALRQQLKQRRQQQPLTSKQLAKLLDESPACIANLESGDNSVSLDLLIRSLLVLGTSKQELARVIAQ